MRKKKEELPDLKKIADWLDKFVPAGSKRKKFQPHVVVNTIGNCLEICLEDCSYYAEWIKGEGADIAIHRANDDDRVVGAMLPLPKNTKKLPVHII